jgi:hypothetical protein
MMADLELVPTDDLVEELVNRCDHLALEMMRVNERGEETHLYIRRWAGNSHTCIGLCWDLASKITEDLRQNQIILDE